MVLWAMYFQRTSTSGSINAKEQINTKVRAMGVETLKQVTQRDLFASLNLTDFKDDDYKKKPLLKASLEDYKVTLGKDIDTLFTKLNVYGNGEDISDFFELDSNGVKLKDIADVNLIKQKADKAMKNRAMIYGEKRIDKKGELAALVTQLDEANEGKYQAQVTNLEAKRETEQIKNVLQEKDEQLQKAEKEGGNIKKLVGEKDQKLLATNRGRFKIKFHPGLRIRHHLNQANLENVSGDEFIKNYKKLLFNAMASTRKFQDKSLNPLNLRSKNISMVDLSLTRMFGTRFGSRSDTDITVIRQNIELSKKLLINMRESQAKTTNPIDAIRLGDLADQIEKFLPKYQQELQNQITQAFGGDLVDQTQSLAQQAKKKPIA